MNNPNEVRCERERLVAELRSVADHIWPGSDSQTCKCAADLLESAVKHIVELEELRRKYAIASEDYVQAQAEMGKLQQERDRLAAQLAQCFKLSGADPDGNEDWRLAQSAVEEVGRLRRDYDEACEEMHGKNGLQARLDAAEKLIDKWRSVQNPTGAPVYQVYGFAADDLETALSSSPSTSAVAGEEK